MKIKVLTIVLFLPIILFSQSNNTQKKILMVVSSYGKDLGATRPGFEFDEFSQAYLIFKSNNVSIDVASPKGGKVEADEFNKDKPYNKLILDDKEALYLLENTKATAKINAENYDAIYVVGGKGAMFDLPYDPSLQEILLKMYNTEGTIISAVCHGPAAFVNVKDNDNYIINNVELTGFCNIEEELFGKKWVKEFPFSLEDKLKSRGATFQQTDFGLSKVVVSGKFVTGQNPYSTARSAEAVVKSLGISPAKRELYPDEKSAYLIQDVLDQTKSIEWIEDELEENNSSYDIPLIAVYGYYKILASSETEAELKKGIQLVELTSPYYFNENLDFVLAKSYIQITEMEKARSVLNKLITKNLLRDQSEKLLQEIK